MTEERISVHSTISQADSEISFGYSDGNMLRLNDKQIRALKAICGTLIGELEEESQLDELCTTQTNLMIKYENKIREFGKFDVRNQKDFLDKIIDRLSKIPSNKLAEVKSNLKRLGGKGGTNSYRLTGSMKPFHELGQRQREAIISKWSTSHSPSIRQMFKLFSYLVCTTFWMDPYDFYPMIGYPGIDPELSSSEGKARFNKFSDYEFIEIDEDVTELKFDIVIIGSGAGGSVIAARLARMTGNSVLVIEKGHHYSQDELGLNQQDGYQKLYERGSEILSEVGGLNVLAGSNFGGGTTVGRSAAVEPPNHLREEWAKKFGLPYFLEEEFNDSMKAIKNRLGVNENNINHNECNKILINGCKNLGASYEIIPQNSASKPHECGWCEFGCKYGEKQSAVMTYLKDAKEFGAKFIQDLMSKKVILASGAINTPAILLRSGLENKNIGKNLYVHPTAGVYGIFPKKEIKPYSGTTMTATCDANENVDGKHYGTRIVVGSHHPVIMNATFPWKSSSFNYKQFMLQYNHIVPLLTITRDRNGGQIKIEKGETSKYIKINKDDDYNIEYKLSNNDAKSVSIGIITGLKILVAAGASKVGTCIAGLEEFEVANENSLNDPLFEQYLEKVKKSSISEHASLGSIHQMGTCRMGDDPSKSVVKPTGETWEVKNLYVADSSLFPTATGVDPMITTMTLALHVAKNILSEKEFLRKKRASSRFSISNISNISTIDNNSSRPSNQRRLSKRLSNVVSNTFSV
ncbi:10231_t:CDS:2 [Diversispora eburnea]|uniref:10231_t:CDS:1 n=1 Tax=Diversispora eburnea TaxID=1213867 RepID=A0A9N8V2B3_9GLOM|nr:10231_t:CDS:2 [Diversispora eburnea]